MVTEGKGEWEDIDDVGKEVHLLYDNEGIGFAWYNPSIEEKMDEWNRGYYKAFAMFLFALVDDGRCVLINVG